MSFHVRGLFPSRQISSAGLVVDNDLSLYSHAQNRLEAVG